MKPGGALNGVPMLDEQDLKLRDQTCRRARLDPYDKVWKARRQGRREIHGRVDYEWNVKTNEGLDQGRRYSIHQIKVQNRGGYRTVCEQREGFRAAGCRTDDFAASVLHGERQVQGDERLIFGDEDG